MARRAVTLSPVLARELAAARPRFNAQIAAARRARAGFDTDALSHAVRTRIDPLAVAVEAALPDRVAAVVDAAFALNLTLVDHALAGERRALIDGVWIEAAVPLAAVVAERPEPVLAMLTNAVLTLASTPGARPDEWIARMAALGPLVTADTLAVAGQIAAWRSGMAHYRAAAIAAADSLPDTLALAAVGATGSWPEVRARLAADRWWSPDSPVDAGTRFGGFAGFGGPFDTPPEVRAGAQGFFVRSGDRSGLLIADAWGATLHPAADEEYDDAAPAVAGPAGLASLPAEGLQAAVAGDSVAIVSPYSHFIEIRPWRR
ncbi:hypothetical protein [Sphingopyxis panaciterrae]